MSPIGRRLFALLAWLSCVCALAVGGAGPAAAQGLFDQPKYASIVVDANTGEVMYALRADQRRFPASISKVMTLYLTFEALATGRLRMDDPVTFSSHAANQAPSKLGVPVGDSITVREAILGVTVKSANDAATALAERVAGSEERFAQLMTLRASELGMRGTQYVNANGLPDSRQISTARDIAILARAIMRDYPQYYGFFNAGSMTWHGHEVVNRHSFLQTIPGVDGLKTGYTNAAGHNLVASAVRDGRRLIVVVLGGPSNALRDENVESLFDAGFAVLRSRALGRNVTLASLMHEPDDLSGPDVRPPYEMGSADQPSLQVVVRDPLKLGYAAPAPRPAPPAAPVVQKASAPASDGCERVKVSGRHGRHRVEVRCNVRRKDAPVIAEAPSAADCKGFHGKLLRACQRDAKVEQTRLAKTDGADCARLKGRKLRACERKADAAGPQVAKADADPCAKLHGRKLKACRRDAGDEGASVAKAQLRDCRKHGRHAKACEADVASAGDAPSAKASGDYMIQVGAFPSRSAAHAKLAKLSRSVSGAQSVESGGKGYRARFGGFTAAQARAACGRLSAKGEACMVVSPG